MPPLRKLILTAAIALVLLIICTIYFFEFQRIEQLWSFIEERDKVLSEKKESIRSYKEKISFYKTREGIEHLAREQYNLVFPGERVIMIVSDDQAVVPPLPGKQ